MSFQGDVFKELRQINFSELREKSFYNKLEKLFNVEVLKDFGIKFDQAVANVSQNRPPQI